MSSKYLIQVTTCPLSSPDVTAAINQHTDATMGALCLPLDHPTRWWYRENIVPDLVEDSTGNWYLACSQLIEDETRADMFKPQDWDYTGLVIRYHECGDSRPSEEVVKQCSTEALADAGLTLIGPRGPIDKMLDGTWQVGDPDCHAYISERMGE